MLLFGPYLAQQQGWENVTVSDLRVVGGGCTDTAVLTTTGNGSGNDVGLSTTAERNI